MTHAAHRTTPSLLLFVFVLAAAGTLPGVSPEAVLAQDPASGTVFRVVGVVEDEHGKPAAGAAVRAMAHGEWFDARTDANGRFDVEVRKKAPGRLARLHASTDDGRRQGWALYNPDAPAAAPGTRAPAAIGATDVRLVLKPAREFPVSVADADGRPVAGARAWAVADFEPVGECVTGESGNAVLRAAADADLRHVLAFKAGAGMDYHVFWAEQAPAKTDPYRLAHDYAGPLRFSLGGAANVTVRVVDQDGLPLKGAVVRPWYFEMPKKGDDANLARLDPYWRKTDERGVAAFELPVNNTTVVTFWARLDGYHAPERCTWDPAAKPAEVTAKLVRQIRLTGRVRDDAGRPAGGATVRVNGDSRQIDDFREQVTTKPDGTFELDVNPDMFYLFAASRDRLVSAPQTRMIRGGGGGGEAAAPVELTLAPATRLFGRVTAGPDRKAAPGASVSLSLQDSKSYYDLPPEQQFPGPQTGVKSITPHIVWNAKAGPDGGFEFFVGPGTYYVRSDQPSGEGAGKIDVTPGGAEVEANVHARQAEPTPLEGRVVLRDEPARGVPDVVVTGDHVDFRDFMRIEGASDAQGRFTLRRGPSDLFLFGVSADKQLKGIVRVPAGEPTATLPVGPTATARGRVIDSDGQPIAGLHIDYGVRIESEPGETFSHRFGGTVKTAQDGTFTADGLIPGFEYEFNAATEFADEGRPSGWRRIGKVTPERAELTDVGELKGVRPPGEGL